MFRSWKFLLGMVSGVGALLLLDSLVLEHYFFKIRRFNIGKKHRITGVKILLVSDLHLNHRFWSFMRWLHPVFKKFAPVHYPHISSPYKRLAKKINQIKPDILLIAGDIVDQYGHISTAREFFSHLDKQLVKIAITGNHDLKNKSGLTRQQLKQLLTDNNGHMLVNETIELEVAGAPFAITGLDDDIEGEGMFVEAVKHIGYRDNHLMLIHSPKQHEYAVKEMQQLNAARPKNEQLNISYIFSGHNHGGQVRIGNIAPVLPEASGNYLEGWYNHDKPFLYLSKGFGTSGIPFRFGARAEVVLFNYGV